VSLVPHRKVGAGGLGGSLAVLMVALADGFGYHLSATVGTALGTVVSFVIAYFVPDADMSVPVEGPDLKE